MIKLFDCRVCGRTFRAAAGGPHLRSCSNQCCLARKRQRGARSRLQSLGLSDSQDIERLVTASQTQCMICGTAPQRHTHLIFDHDHTTGKLRGVLCERCNLVLGKIGDSVELLKMMIQYLGGAPNP